MLKLLGLGGLAAWHDFSFLLEVRMVILNVYLTFLLFYTSKQYSTNNINTFGLSTDILILTDLTEQSKKIQIYKQRDHMKMS